MGDVVTLCGGLSILLFFALPFILMWLWRDEEGEES